MLCYFQIFKEKLSLFLSTIYAELQVIQIRSEVNRGKIFLSLLYLHFFLIEANFERLFLANFSFLRVRFHSGKRRRHPKPKPSSTAARISMTKAGLTRTLLFSVAEKKLAQNFLAKKNPEFFFGFEDKSISEKCKTASFSFFFASLTKEKSLTLIRLKEKK